MAGGKPEVVVLKKNLDEEGAMEIVEKRKTAPFRKLLSGPKPGEVHVDSLTLTYECTLIVSGRYVADYYRKATHTITVPHNVREVVLGGGVFGAKTRSGISKALSGSKAKNKISIGLEEHVFLDEKDEVAFDHHGRKAKFRHKASPEELEHYPDKILGQDHGSVKGMEITRDAAIEQLATALKKPIESEVRDLNEEFELVRLTEAYVPVYEARLVGPKEKVGLLRIDAVRKKVL